MLKAERGKMNEFKAAVNSLKESLDNLANGDYNTSTVSALQNDFKNVNYANWSDDVKDKLKVSTDETSTKLDSLMTSISSGNFKNIRTNTDLILETIGYYETANSKFYECERKINDPANADKEQYLKDLKQSRSKYSSQLFGYLDTINEYVDRYKTYDFEGDSSVSLGDVSSLADGTIAELPEEPKTQYVTLQNGTKVPLITTPRPSNWGESMGQYNAIYSDSYTSVYRVDNGDLHGYYFVTVNYEPIISNDPKDGMGIIGVKEVYQYGVVSDILVPDSNTAISFITNGGYLSQNTFLVEYCVEGAFGGKPTYYNQEFVYAKYTTSSQDGAISEGSISKFVSENTLTRTYPDKTTMGMFRDAHFRYSPYSISYQGLRAESSAKVPGKY